MRGTKISTVLLLVLLLAVFTPTASGLPIPITNLPDGWVEKENIPYPGTAGFFDSKGSGSISFVSEDKTSFVLIKYEDSNGYVNAHKSLANFAADTLAIYLNLSRSSFEVDSSTVANVSAGYAGTYLAQSNNYYYEFAFVKGNYFFNVFVGYPGVGQYGDQVLSIVDSVQVGANGGTPIEIYVLGAMIVASVLIVLLIIKTLRKT